MFKTIKSLLPNGKAYRLNDVSSNHYKFWEAISETCVEFRTYLDNQWFDIFPQTTTKLARWEAEFGMIVSPDLTEQQRRDNLTAEWKDTGGQTKEYIQEQLRSRGFDVYVYDWDANLSPEGPSICEYLLKNKLTFTETENYIECGSDDAECGGVDTECGALPQAVSRVEDPATPLEQYWHHFIYISGASFGDPITIPATRKDEFDALILKLRPLGKWVGVNPENIT